MRRRRPRVHEGAILTNDLTPLESTSPRTIRRLDKTKLRTRAEAEQAYKANIERINRMTDREMDALDAASQSDGGR